MNDIENEIRQVFRHVRSATVPPPVPSLRQAPRAALAPARSRTSRRLGLVIGVGVGLSSVGFAAAAATGLLPSSYWGHDTPGAFNAIPGTERLTATATDATGTKVQLWLADAVAENGDKNVKGELGYCAVFRLPDEPTTNNTPGGGCSGPVGDGDWNTFGASGVSVGDIFATRVPGASRVELIQPDGKTAQELDISQDWTVGWIDSTKGPRSGAVIVGYDTGGHEVARTTPRPLRTR